MQVITLKGRIGRDPEERTTTSGLKLVTFSLAVQAGKEKVMWYDINIWDQHIARFSKIIPHLKKGSGIIVVGELGIMDTYQSKSGETKIRCKVQPHVISFAPSNEKKPEPQPRQVESPFGEQWEERNTDMYH